ncbi:MAG TPA: sigma-70 family RNA polymerase sigma factor [Candidatus Limnocylindrales bacterium]|nr:sigma-70 family RNA polymerase sigma factor [Candidatus Limnocylindrales bacterium]
MAEREIETTLLPHLDSAYNLARWLSRSEDDAKDITQEAFARALRFFPSLKGSAKPWLLSIVRNTFYTSIEQNRRTQHEPFDEEQHGAADDALGPELLSMRNADVVRMRSAVEALPAEYREAIVLRELEGFSYAEIAEITGVPIGTVMSRISRARAKAETLLRRGGK